VKKEEALPIEAPSVNVRRSALGALEPDQIGPRGVERAGRVGEKGGEQEHPDRQPDQARGDESPGAEKILRAEGAWRGARKELVEEQSAHGGGDIEDKGLLGGLHQSDGRAGEQKPGDFSSLAIAPAGREGQKDEENEEGFVNIVATVIDHHGRDGGQESGGQGGVPAQAVGNQKEQQNQADAEENGEGPQAEFGEAGEIPGQGQFFPDQGGVGEGGAVEFGRVVAVSLAFPQIARI
jgi:hypothetical protein